MTAPTPTAERRPVAGRMWPPAPRSVGRVRRFLVQHLDAWGLPHITESASLVVSELVTNAVAHAHPPYGSLIGVRLERLESGVRIEVHDANDSRPERRDASAEEESGRGLALVDALTDGQWGVSDRRGPGKMVWAMVHGSNSVSGDVPA